MSDLPRVSIQILNYNGGEDILRCLRSVRRLSFRDFRVVVIDNASTDGSLAYIEAEFPEVIIVRNATNLGFGAGHNVGLRDALEHNISFVWLLNQDATVAPDSLGHLVEAARANSSVSAISPLVFNADDTLWFESGKINWLRMRAVHARRISSHQPEYLSGCAIFLRTETLKKTGLFDEGFFLYYDDADLSLRIRQAGFRLLVEPKSRVWHTEASNRHAEIKTLWLVWSGFLFFKKHTPILLRPWAQLWFCIRLGNTALRTWLTPSPLQLALGRLYRFFLHQYGFLPFLLHPRQLPKRFTHPPVAAFLADDPHRDADLRNPHREQ